MTYFAVKTASVNKMGLFFFLKELVYRTQFVSFIVNALQTGRKTFIFPSNANSWIIIPCKIFVSENLQPLALPMILTTSVLCRS